MKMKFPFFVIYDICHKDIVTEDTTSLLLK